MGIVVEKYIFFIHDTKNDNMKLFGTSGIRGLYGQEITESLALNVGKAIGTLLDGSVAVGMDSRTSGPSLKNSLIAGIVSQGNTVYDIGLAPTPTLGVAIREYGCNAGIIITASHNPPEYNGMKIWDKDGVAYFSLEEQIEQIISTGAYSNSSWKSMGDIIKRPSINLHIDKIINTVSFDGSYRVAVDCGGGAGSVITPYLLERLGMQVFSLNCQPTGFFSRGLEPSCVNLQSLSHAVSSFNCDIGIANDGDADRIGAIDEEGKYIDYDILLSLIAGFECSISKKAHPIIVTTVDASMCIDKYVESFGGKVVRSCVGDVALARDVVGHKAIFGGEPSGTWIFPSHWLTPDGVLSAVKLLEMKDSGIILSKERKNVPPLVTLRDKITMGDIDREAFEVRLSESLYSEEHESMLTIDGIRMDYGDSWVLYRFSGTEPAFRITVEACSRERAKELLVLARKKVSALL